MLKTYQITLNEEQLLDLADIVNQHEPIIDEDKDEAEQIMIGEETTMKVVELLALFDKVQVNPAATNMLYINVYEVSRIYGGPEEGGWDYTNLNCLYSRGYSLNLDANPYDTIIDAYCEEVRERATIATEVNREPLYEMIAEGYDCHKHVDRDRILIAIETAPGLQHDTSVRHYE